MQNYILILNRASILPKKIVRDLIFFFLQWLDGLICYARVYIDDYAYCLFCLHTALFI